MNSKKVIICKPTNFEVDFQVNPKLDKNGNPFGYIRISQPTINLDYSYNGGVKDNSALKAMTVEAFAKVKDVLVEGLQLPGKIATFETIDANIHKNGVGTGFSPKIAGDKGIQLTNGGLPIFRRTEYFQNENDPRAIDTLVQHEQILSGVQKQTATLN